MTELKGPLLLVGGGKMGGAMLRGWLGRLAPKDAIVVEPNRAAMAAESKLGVAVHETPEAIPAGFKPRVVVLAVKPQMMAAALPAYRRFAQKGTLFVSVAAGKTIGYFERGLGGDAAIVRSMPNTPAAVGRGITVATSKQCHE
jgi:pyrroline-5-carboxylate reductase